MRILKISKSELTIRLGKRLLRITVLIRSFIRALKEGLGLPKSSFLKALNPFLDGNEVLRLGGRLRHSFLSYGKKFPVILPKHQLSALIAENAHRRALHGDTQLTLRVLRQNFWILAARSLIKSIINRIPYLRERADMAQQLMGDLPLPRVTPSVLFFHCGVDYAGPIMIIIISPYVGRVRKSYVAIFVCLATRAVYLELVSDYEILRASDTCTSTNVQVQIFRVSIVNLVELFNRYAEPVTFT